MFFDRYDAGQQLARKLLHYMGAKAVVYGLPRGGVLTGFEVARALDLPLDTVITRKIKHPLNSECAICAITEDGERVCDELGLCGLDPEWVEIESKIQQAEAHRRRVAYRKNGESISAKGKIAILVDDGAATGLTMKAAILAIKKQNPHKIVVAIPVAPHEVLKDISHIADEVVSIKDEHNYRGFVSSYYSHFPEVFDKEVMVALNQAESIYKKKLINRKFHDYVPA